MTTPQMTTPNVTEYIRAHMGGPPDGLAAPLKPDFGQAEPPPPEEAVDTEAIRAHCQHLRELVAQAQADRCPWGATKAIYQQSMAKIMDRDIGPIKDVADQIEELLGKAEGPVDPPPPPPTQYDSFGGSYPGHDPAFDHYPNGESGPHGGHIYRCPVAGTVERYSFATPLQGKAWVIIHQTQSVGRVATWEVDAHSTETNGEWVPLVTEAEQAIMRTLGTQMHIAVFRPAQPLTLENGQQCRALWIGHVAAGFATGQRAKGDPFAVCANSGVEFPTCDASHGHVCGSADGGLSPNGNVPGLLVARALGYRPRVTQVPGPNEYASGGWDRGKRR
jgi:hypothetical protein